MLKKLIEFLARLFKRNKNKENEKNEETRNHNKDFSDDKPEELVMIDCDFFKVEEIDDENEENDENSFTI